LKAHIKKSSAEFLLSVMTTTSPSHQNNNFAKRLFFTVLQGGPKK